jgi:hypothetical protein
MGLVTNTAEINAHNFYHIKHTAVLLQKFTSPTINTVLQIFLFLLV